MIRRSARSTADRPLTQATDWQPRLHARLTVSDRQVRRVALHELPPSLAGPFGGRPRRGAPQGALCQRGIQCPRAEDFGRVKPLAPARKGRYPKRGAARPSNPGQAASRQRQADEAIPRAPQGAARHGPRGCAGSWTVPNAREGIRKSSHRGT